jgi:Ca-activated chloride channel family protein
MRGLALILLSSLGLLFSGDQTVNTGASRAEPPASPAVPHSDTTIVVNSNLVVIPVTVTDDRGSVVSGLEKEHFTLFEDNSPQEITHFASEDAPVSIGIVFDASDSMGPKMGKARQAVNSLLASANPDDEFFLVRFSTEAHVMVHMTSQPDEIRERVRSMDVRGTTALLDGVRLALDEMRQARHSRKAIIIVSDGEDNASQWTVEELKAAVREQDVLVYAIGITDPSMLYVTWPPPRQSGPALLNEITAQTGGRLFEVKKLNQLPEVASKIGSCLRNQYMLGYVPSRLEKDGKYRAISVKVARPKGFPRLHAIWRRGYYAPKGNS